MDTICTICQKTVPAGSLFCPNCGVSMQNIDPPFSTGYKIKVYILSVLLAPFGLFWFFKYFNAVDGDKRKLAYTALVITISAIMFMIGIVFVAASYYVYYVNSLL